MAHDLMRCSRPTIVCQCMQPTTRVKWHGYLSHLVPLTKPPISAAATTNTSYCFNTATDIYKYGEKMCMCCCLVWGCLMKRILPLIYSVPAFFPWLPGAASPNSIWNWFHTGGQVVDEEKLRGVKRCFIHLSEAFSSVVAAESGSLSFRRNQNQGCQVGSIIQRLFGRSAASTSSVTPRWTDCGGSVEFSSYNAR